MRAGSSPNEGDGAGDAFVDDDGEGDVGVCMTFVFAFAGPDRGFLGFGYGCLRPKVLRCVSHLATAASFKGSLTFCADLAFIPLYRVSGFRSTNDLRLVIVHQWMEENKDSNLARRRTKIASHVMSARLAVASVLSRSTFPRMYSRQT